MPLGPEPAHRLNADVLRGGELPEAVEQGNDTEKCKSSHRAPGSLSLASRGPREDILWSRHDVATRYDNVSMSVLPAGQELGVTGQCMCLSLAEGKSRSEGGTRANSVLSSVKESCVPGRLWKVKRTLGGRRA